jgi:hypothetical protein
MILMRVEIHPPHAGASLGNLMILGLMGTVFVTLFWVLGWQTAIRFTDTHVSTTNFFSTATVAWSDVTDVTMTNGLSIRLRDGEELGNLQFGGSLIGDLTGYPTHRRAWRILHAAWQQAQPQDAEGRYKARSRSMAEVPVLTSMAWRQTVTAAVLIYASFMIAPLFRLF